MTTREEYLEKIKKADRSYHAMFPTIRSLKTKKDVKAFMEAYVDAMKPIIQSKLDRPLRADNFFDNTVRYGMLREGLTLEDAAKNLALDNFTMMADVYYANTYRPVPRCWNKMIIEVAGTEKTREFFT